jgi:hypothetical protein
MVQKPSAHHVLKGSKLNTPKSGWLNESFSLCGFKQKGSPSHERCGLRISRISQVALKCLEAKDKEVVQCRKQEFEVLHQLEHPNIADLADMDVMGDIMMS